MEIGKPKRVVRVEPVQDPVRKASPPPRRTTDEPARTGRVRIR